MSVRVLVELNPSMDSERWSRLYDKGQVPDRVPYGLHRLADDGFSVLVRKPRRSHVIEIVSRAGGKLTAGARWPEALLGTPRPDTADVQLCWDERSGIPAIMMQPRGSRRRPVVTGVIWVTEPDVNLSAVARWTVRRALQRAEAIFVNSHGQVSPLREMWGVDPARIHFIHFGVDTDFWDPSLPTAADLLGTSSLGTPDIASEGSERLTIVSVGNDRHRDHGLLLSAMTEVHAALPQTRLELVTGAPLRIPAEVGRRHQSLIHSQLRDLYCRAHVVVVCTRLNNHCSGLTATLEAMAMGKPVVVTRTPGLDDYVIDGETGILVPHGDRDGIAGVLIELLNDPDRREQLGTQARKHALDRFSTRAQAGRLAAVLNSVT
jgi:glycosyltransferase involved in cell wall biosynthesis